MTDGRILSLLNGLTDRLSPNVDREQVLDVIERLAKCLVDDGAQYAIVKLVADCRIRRTVTIVSEDYPDLIDYSDAMDDARADPAIYEIHQIEAGRLRRVVRRDASAQGGWTAQRIDDNAHASPCT